VVEPVGVVHEANERPGLGDVRQQSQNREADEEWIGLTTVAQPKGGAQRVSLWRGQPIDSVEDRHAELVELRERKLHLRLDADRSVDAEAVAVARDVVEQGGLATPGLAVDDQCGALTASQSGQQLVESGALNCAPPELRSPPICRDLNAHFERG
jgi:hypothetical protein